MRVREFQGKVNGQLRCLCKEFGVKLLNGCSLPIYMDGAPAGCVRFEFEVLFPEKVSRAKER